MNPHSNLITDNGNFDNIALNCPDNKSSTVPKQVLEWFLAPENGFIKKNKPSLQILSDLVPKFTHSDNPFEDVCTSPSYSSSLSFDDNSPRPIIHDGIKTPGSTGSNHKCNCRCFDECIDDSDDQNKKITILLSKVVGADEYESKLIWKYLEESNLPNFLPIITNSAHQVNFEMLLTQARRFDFRFFSMKEMELFVKITSGPFKERKLASRILLDKLKMLCDSNDNIGSIIIKKLGMETPNNVIIDTVIRILGNRALDLVQQDNGCFLIQHLYHHCSDKMKEFLAYYLVPKFNKLVKDRRGNYMCTMLITFTQDIKEYARDKDTQKMNAKKRQIWKDLVRKVIENAEEFYHLSCNEFGSFVMKKFVRHLEYDEQKSILFRLNALGLLSNMFSSEFGGFVIKNLLNSFRHHAHLLTSWHDICIN